MHSRTGLELEQRVEREQHVVRELGGGREQEQEQEQGGSGGGALGQVRELGGGLAPELELELSHSVVC